jgi:hypothetical protein
MAGFDISGVEALGSVTKQLLGWLFSSFVRNSMTTKIT